MSPSYLPGNGNRLSCCVSLIPQILNNTASVHNSLNREVEEGGAPIPQAHREDILSVMFPDKLNHSEGIGLRKAASNTLKQKIHMRREPRQHDE